MVEIGLNDERGPLARWETTQKTHCQLRWNIPVLPAGIVLLRNVTQVCSLVCGIFRSSQRQDVVVARPVVVIQVSSNRNQQNDIRPPCCDECCNGAAARITDQRQSVGPEEMNQGIDGDVGRTRRPPWQTCLRSNSIQRMRNRNVPQTGRVGRDRRRCRPVAPARGVRRADRRASDPGWGAIRPPMPDRPPRYRRSMTATA